MLNFFHAIGGKIAAAIASVVILFSNAAIPPAPSTQPATIDAATSTMQVTRTTSEATTTLKVESRKSPQISVNENSTIGSFRKQIEELAQKVNHPSDVQKKERRTEFVTRPSGAVVEMDEYGNVLRVIKEAPPQPQATATPAASTTLFPILETEQERLQREHIAEVKAKVADYNAAIKILDDQIAQVNADYAKMGTGVTAYDTEMWNRALQSLAPQRVPLVRAQAPYLAELNAYYGL